MPFEMERLQGSSRKAWNSYPVCIQPKLDGERCRREPGNGLLLSSTEEIIYSVPHIHEELQRLNPPFETDGELYIHGWDFEDIHSVVSRTKNIHPKHLKMEYHIFDIASDSTDYPQLQRLLDLKKWFKEYVPPTSPIKLVPFKLANNLTDVLTIGDEYINDKYEGFIARHLLANYYRKRSTMVMKFKPKKRDDYKIIGYTEEYDKSNNPKNRLGSLLLCGANGDQFAVYSGFDDVLREFLWSVRDTDLVGRFITVHYQNLTAARGVPHFGAVKKNELKVLWEIN